MAESVFQNCSWRIPLLLGLAGALVASAPIWLPRVRAGTGVANSHLVTIAAGEYVIGTDSAPPRLRPIVGPQHTLRVAAFTIERTEVIVADYRRFVGAHMAAAPWPGAVPFDSLPVTGVPWGDAARFCEWKYPNGGRLPTEFEWEAAARGVLGRVYSYGSLPESARANTASSARRQPMPVGSFPRGATPEGLLDLIGNVWEWTSSPLKAYPGAKPLADSMQQYRVIRGGAFDTSDDLATGWMRGYLRVSTPPEQLDRTGFRCAFSAVGKR